jgi:hypothetical protein
MYSSSVDHTSKPGADVRGRRSLFGLKADFSHLVPGRLIGCGALKSDALNPAAVNRGPADPKARLAFVAVPGWELNGGSVGQ